MIQFSLLAYTYCFLLVYILTLLGFGTGEIATDAVVFLPLLANMYMINSKI